MCIEAPLWLLPTPIKTSSVEVCARTRYSTATVYHISRVLQHMENDNDVHRTFASSSLKTFACCRPRSSSPLSATATRSFWRVGETVSAKDA